jgi:hypothetical protein
LAPPKRRPRLLVSAACSTRAANGPRLRISVTGVGRDTLAGLNAATSGGQLDNQAETRQPRFGHYLRTTFHPLPGDAYPIFTANVLPYRGDGEERLEHPSLPFRQALAFATADFPARSDIPPSLLNGFLAAPFHDPGISS